jgi:hypothetical protein
VADRVPFRSLRVHAGRCSHCNGVADLFVIFYSVVMLCPACTLPRLLALGSAADEDFPLFQLTREVRKEVQVRARGPSIWLYGEAGAEPQPCRCGSSGFPLSQQGSDYLDRHILLGRLYCPGCESRLARDLT